jgi:serine/threonine protein kinase
MFRRTDFKKLELLGGGKKNTKVFKVKHIKTQKQYVLKEVEARNLDKLNEYKEEAVQLSRVQNHPNILQFYGYYFYETPHNTFKLGIISELITNDSNLELIYRKREKSRIFWTEPQLLQMIYSMIDAFSYLEYIGICHRDIKPTNLFLMDNYQIKVIDFGESKESFDEEDEDHTTMATIRGTPQYLSPILWEAHVITQAKQVEHNVFKSDVFSAGLVLFQMAAMMDVSGFNQKTSNVDGEKLIREGLRMISKRYSNNIIEILGKMLQFNEDKRPNFIELGKFIAGNDFVPRTDKSIMQYIRERVTREQNQSQNQNVNNNKNKNQNNNIIM